MGFNVWGVGFRVEIFRFRVFAVLRVVYVLIFVPMYSRGVISNDNTESAFIYHDLTRSELIVPN